MVLQHKNVPCNLLGCVAKLHASKCKCLSILVHFSDYIHDTDMYPWNYSIHILHSPQPTGLFTDKSMSDRTACVNVSERMQCLQARVQALRTITCIYSQLGAQNTAPEITDCQLASHLSSYGCCAPSQE